VVVWGWIEGWSCGGLGWCGDGMVYGCLRRGRGCDGCVCLSRDGFLMMMVREGNGRGSGRLGGGRRDGDDDGDGGGWGWRLGMLGSRGRLGLPPARSSQLRFPLMKVKIKRLISSTFWGLQYR
jgi:hypothetical protein